VREFFTTKDTKIKKQKCGKNFCHPFVLFVSFVVEILSGN
jgi:hypothetical protein